MSKLDVLLKLVQTIVSDVSNTDDLSEESNVVIKNEASALPVVVEDNNLVVYAGTQEGRQVKDAIFEQAVTLMDKGERAVETGFAELIHDAEPFSELERNDSQLLEKLRPIVPISDIPIIAAGLFIRRLYKNKKNVTHYKQLIHQQYGSRGGNISNLVSADYYENYVIPTYDQLAEEEEEEVAKGVFREMYEEAVTQYPFAVFVSMRRDYSDIKDEVLKKIQLNLLNNQHFLNIHGIGDRNKKTIVKILDDTDITKFYISEPDIVELKKTIFSRLYF